MRTIKDVIKAIPQLQNQDYDDRTMGSYGEGEYYEFDDGSIVMEENDLEIYHCARTQEYFWDDFNNNLEEEWVYDTIDKGSNWANYSMSEFVEELYNKYVDLWSLNITVHKGDLESGVEEAFGDYEVSISSNLRFVKDLYVNFKDLFEGCYSKTEKMFVLIMDAGNEDLAAISIAEKGFGMTAADDDIIFAIERGAAELANSLGAGEDLSKDKIQKIISLIESDEESIVQAFEIAKTIDAPNANKAILNSPRVKDIVDKMARARIVVSEIEPESWDGTYIDNYGGSYFVSDIQERISENIDENKPFTMVSAFIGRKEVDDYIYINEPKINWNLCENLKVDIDVFDDSYAISNENFKKTYKMKDWYIALK